MPIERLHSQRLLVGVILVLGIFVTGMPRAPGESATLTPAQIKVGLLYNFAVQTQWPSSAFAGPSSPFVFGILGEDPFRENLDFLKRKTINKRRVVVKSGLKLEEAPGCHILFISASEKAQVPEILKALENTSVLTVSELDNFIELHGMVNFYAAPVEGSATVGTIRFEINEAAVEKAGLSINSYVLKMKKNRK